VRTVLDAYAMIGFVLDEPAAGEVERLLRDGDAAITSVNYAEALDRLVRGQNMPWDTVESTLASVLEARVERIDVDFRLATAAALLRATHYHRTECPLSLADCVCLAAARRGDRVATADRPMLETARQEGIATVPLASPAA
jgi:PIN domain nuclease of toxin-antitoxin system